MHDPRVRDLDGSQRSLRQAIDHLGAPSPPGCERRRKTRLEPVSNPLGRRWLIVACLTAASAAVLLGLLAA